jgi:antitoxin component of MazEF toxin-antitoxin module
MMRVKLRQVGNSVGLTIPANELQALDAKVGDEVELEIKQVIHHARVEWDDPEKWQGVKEEPMLLDGVQENTFDKEEWEW